MSRRLPTLAGRERPANLALLMREAFVALNDLAIDRLAERGHGVVRPAHNAVFQFLDDTGTTVSLLAARAQISTKNVAFRLGYGDVWRAVLSIQDEVDAQVVVMMKRKATPIADFILGSTVRRLLTRLSCDVLLAPPAPMGQVSGARVALPARPQTQP